MRCNDMQQSPPLNQKRRRKGLYLQRSLPATAARPSASGPPASPAAACPAAAAAAMASAAAAPAAAARHTLRESGPPRTSPAGPARTLPHCIPSGVALRTGSEFGEARLKGAEVLAQTEQVRNLRMHCVVHHRCNALIAQVLLLFFPVQSLADGNACHASQQPTRQHGCAPVFAA